MSPSKKNFTGLIRPIGMLFGLLGMAYAAPVDSSTAQLVAQQFIQQSLSSSTDTNSSLGAGGGSSLTLPPIQSITPNLKNGVVNFYTVNFQNGGFVLISAEDKARPILAFSFDSSFPDTVANESLQDLMSNYHDAIAQARIDTTLMPEISNSWQVLRRLAGLDAANLDSTTGPNLPIMTGQVFGNIQVNALLTTNWDQGSPWNTYAPAATGGPGGKAYAGCVATAVSQIMKYNKFPSQGQGSHGGINFANESYDWSSMSDNTATDGAEHLLRDVGAAVDMMYGASGSGAYSQNVPTALTTYFKYNASTIKYVARTGVADADWYAMLRTEISQKRPVYYSGSGNVGGHAFVMDGIMDNNYGHFNFGWSGYANGWYATTAINPGTMNFNSSQAIVVGIQAPGYKKTTGTAFAGITASGSIVASGDLSSLGALNQGGAWSSISAGLATLVVGDLDGDKKDDFAGLDAAGKIWFSTNRQNWSYLNLSWKMKTLALADMNGDGKQDFYGLDVSGNVWYSNGYSSWYKLTGPMTYVSVGDPNGEGKLRLLAVDTKKQGWISNDQGTWTKLTLPTGGLTSINSSGDVKLWGIDATGSLEYLSGTTWTKLAGVVSNVKRVDLNHSGSNNGWLATTATGTLLIRRDGASAWSILQASGVKLADIRPSGSTTLSDIFSLNTSTKILSSSLDSSHWLNYSGTFASFAFGDLSGSGSKTDIIALGTNGYIYFTSSTPESWVASPKSLISADLQSKGVRADLVALDGDGYIRYSLGGKAWQLQTSPVPMVYIIAGDLDGSGYLKDLVAVGNDGKTYISKGLGSWTVLNTSFSKIYLLDLKGTGVQNGFVGISSAGKASYSLDGNTWTVLSGAWNIITGIDIQKSGYLKDLVGVNTSGQVMISTNKTTWTRVGTAVVSSISVGDLDGDGYNNDIAAVSSTHLGIYTTDRINWKTAGTGIYTLQISDLTGSGKLNGLVAQDANGNVEYSTDLVSWTNVGGKLKLITLGDFQNLFDTSGAFTPMATTGPSTSILSPVSNLKVLSLDQDNLQIQGTKDFLQVDLIGVNGATWRIYSDFNSNGSISLPIGQSLAGSGKYWIQIRQDAEVLNIPWIKQ